MKELILFHITAFSIGCVLDLCIGDPYWMPHPIRWIGRLIGFLDRKLLGTIAKDEKGNAIHNPKKERILGAVLTTIIVSVTGIVSTLLMILSYRINPYVGMIMEAIMTTYILAAKSLRTESMKVYKALNTGDLAKSRLAVSMIVGRDTDCLDEVGIIKATVETIAENTSDGVVAPLLYTCIGGPVLGFIYKAINTCDSMVGYHNDRYEYFGTASARLDDVVNFIPARISAWLMIAVALLPGKEYNARHGIRIYRRDRYNHKSPNSAQTESACAGILGVELAGDATYFGHLIHKPTIGDAYRPVDIHDIPRTCKLMYATALLGFGIGIIIVLGIWIIL